MKIIAPGKPGGSFEGLATMISNAVPGSTVECIQQEDALEYAFRHSGACIYTSWEHELKPLPIQWLAESYDSFVTKKDNCVTDLFSYYCTIGCYYHPVRVHTLILQLTAMGSNAQIKTYDCFTGMAKGLETDDFIYGNSLKLYKAAGAIEILTSQPDVNVPHFSKYITDHKLANTKTKMGIVSYAHDLPELRASMLDTTAITDRGYEVSEDLL